MTETTLETEKPKRKCIYYPEAAKRYNNKPEIREKRLLYGREYRLKEDFKQRKKQYKKNISREIKI
jgi:hypothetical protein